VETAAAVEMDKEAFGDIFLMISTLLEKGATQRQENADGSNTSKQLPSTGAEFQIGAGTIFFNLRAGPR